MVIVTRAGNPLNLADFSDLGRPGLRLLHADPRSSGAGDWSVLAEYGNAFLPSGDRAAGSAGVQQRDGAPYWGHRPGPHCPYSN